MRKLLSFLVIVFCIMIVSCKSTEYIEVPIETIKTEYRNQLRIDTVVARDSVVIREKGDTVIFEKYKYVYRVKEIKDTINITDTIPVITTVEVTKEVNKLHTWQIVLMCLGGGMIVLFAYNVGKNVKIG